MTTMMTRRSTQYSLAQKSNKAKNDDERAFLRVRHHRRDSRNLSGMCGVLSHHRNSSKLCASRAAGAHCNDGSGEMRM